MPRNQWPDKIGMGGRILSESVVGCSRNAQPYLRKTKSVEELLPWLYLKGISTGDFSEALAAFLGPEEICPKVGDGPDQAAI